MDPSSFQFTVTLPGDARLVSAVRELAVQVATYAGLAQTVSSAFAGQVSSAMEAAIAATHLQNAPIECRFDGDGDAVRLTISCDADPASPLDWARGDPESVEGSRPPASAPAGGASVNWSREGSRQICRIRQPR